MPEKKVRSKRERETPEARVSECYLERHLQLPSSDVDVADKLRVEEERGWVFKEPR